MVIIEDTRNQVGKHKAINAYLEAAGHKVVRSKLLVGDYQIANQGKIVIDTKKDVVELAMDMFRDHARFRRECELAQNAGITLIVLTEEELPRDINGNPRIDLWVSPRFKRTSGMHKAGEPVTRADPSRLRKALKTMTLRYGVKFRFCDPQHTGQWIIHYLSGGV